MKIILLLILPEIIGCVYSVHHMSNQYFSTYLILLISKIILQLYTFAPYYSLHFIFLSLFFYIHLSILQIVYTPFISSLIWLCLGSIPYLIIFNKILNVLLTDMLHNQTILTSVCNIFKFTIVFHLLFIAVYFLGMVYFPLFSNWSLPEFPQSVNERN